MNASDASQGGLSDDEKRENVVRLVFGSDRKQFDQFCQVIKDAMPEGTRVVMRGSAVTGRRWNDEAPFDADGPGTSDVDLTLVGNDVLGAFKVSGFFVPGVHSRPLGDDDPEIAPALMGLRRKLTEMAGRPVNIQATRDFVMYLRGEIMGQPYLTLLGDPDAS